MAAMPNEVDQFLKANGFLKGKYVKLGEFSAPHHVSDEESAIYKQFTVGSFSFSDLVKIGGI